MFVVDVGCSAPRRTLLCLKPISYVRIPSASYQICTHLFPFCVPWLFPCPFSLSLSLSLSLFCARACAPLRLLPSSTHSFACVDVARLVPNQLFLCRLCGRTGCGCGSIVFSCGSGWRGGRCCVSFFLLFSSTLFPLPYISPAFLSFPVSAIVLACHML